LRKLKRQRHVLDTHRSVVVENCCCNHVDRRKPNVRVERHCAMRPPNKREMRWKSFAKTTTSCAASWHKAIRSMAWLYIATKTRWEPCTPQAHTLQTPQALQALQTLREQLSSPCPAHSVCSQVQRLKSEVNELQAELSQLEQLRLSEQRAQRPPSSTEVRT
jgi:hypothetical protein